MAFNTELANRVRPLLARIRGHSEKKMFGGIAFLLGGKMCVGVWKEFLILRLGLDQSQAALQQPFVRAFDITGKAMKGWVMVEAPALETDAELHDWTNQAVRFVRTLPEK